MLLIEKNLKIRNAVKEDARQLARWWNDGRIMAHAGFPNGTGQTAEEIAESIEKDTDEAGRRLIIEIDRISAGEMVYRRMDESTAEIGIKICDNDYQNQGYGKRLILMLLESLFYDMGYKRIILDTNTLNKRAQHVYETLGFHKLRTVENAWKNQLGVMQSAVEYELLEKDYKAKSKVSASEHPTASMIVRTEQESDYQTVEDITRKAFYNLYVPGANEHYLVHIMRKHEDFIPELDFVIELNGAVIGNIMYTKARLVEEQGEVKNILTFGPISVHPEYQRCGAGKKLMEHSFRRALELGYEVIVIFGSPANYVTSGFRCCKTFNVSVEGGTFPTAMMVKELKPGALDGRKWTYYDSPVMQVDEALAEQFDRSLEKMDKKYLPIQEEFAILSKSIIQ